MPTGIYKRTAAQYASRVGRKRTKQQRLKLSEIRKVQCNTTEWKKRIRIQSKNNWKRPSYRRNVLRGLNAHLKKYGRNFKGGNGQRPVRFVVNLQRIIKPAGFVREYAIGVKWPIGNYKVDFAHVQAKIAIECDGPCHKKIRQKLLDKKKDRILKSLGWRIIRVPHD